MLLPSMYREAGMLAVNHPLVSTSAFPSAPFLGAPCHLNKSPSFITREPSITLFYRTKWQTGLYTHWTGTHLGYWQLDQFATFF